MSPIYVQNGAILVDGGSLRGCCCTPTPPPTPTPTPTRPLFSYQIYKCIDFSPWNVYSYTPLTTGSVYHLSTDMDSFCCFILGGPFLGNLSAGLVIELPVLYDNCDNCLIDYP